MYVNYRRVLYVLHRANNPTLPQIHKAPHRWTAVKGAYLVCRYYPIIVFPFQLWAWLGDHTYGVCSNALTPLYVTLLPLVSFVPPFVR